jgi:hypothetical protein
MHSTEWNIGQAAGAAAAFSIQAGIQPRDIPRNEKYLRLLQLRLIAARPASPIYWCARISTVRLHFLTLNIGGVIVTMPLSLPVRV